MEVTKYGRVVIEEREDGCLDFKIENFHFELTERVTALDVVEDVLLLSLKRLFEQEFDKDQITYG